MNCVVSSNEYRCSLKYISQLYVCLTCDSNMTVDITVTSHKRHGVSNSHQLTIRQIPTNTPGRLMRTLWSHITSLITSNCIIQSYVHNFYSESIVHDDVIKWKHFPRYWPFVRGISAWIYGWINNRESGDLRRHRAHYDVILMDIYLGVTY